MPSALAAYGVLDATTWAVLALLLTVLGVVGAWVAWRRRGFAAGLRGLAWALLPLAAWLTGTLRLAANILADIGSWAVHLVFSPVVWLGVIVAGVAGVLWVVSGVLRARGIGVRRNGDKVRGRAERPAPAVKGARPAAKRAEPDDDMDEIEAILRKHGI